MAYIYVRDGGTATGSGGVNGDWTFTNCYDQVTSAESVASRGDTIYVAGGTYTGVTFNVATSGSTYITVKKATASDHGTETGWSSVYGTAQAQFTSQLVFASSYWIFDGVSGGGPGSWTSGHGFKVTEFVTTASIIRIGRSSTANYVTIAHVHLVGLNDSTSSGGSLGNDAFDLGYSGVAENITIQYVYVEHTGRCHFWTHGGLDVITVEYSYFGRHWSSGSTHSEIWSSNQSSNMTIRYCIFTHAESTGGLIIFGNYLSVYGCVFVRLSGNPAWRFPNGVIGTWSSDTLNYVRVYNNSFINLEDAAYGLPILGSLYSSATDNLVRNNLFYLCVNVGSSGLWDEVSYNHFVDTTSVGTNATTGSGDPFVDYENLDFTLEAATTAGYTLGSPYTIDALGITRGADGTWDRGAYEYYVAGPSRLPRYWIVGGYLNLVENGGFDSDTTSWTSVNSTISSTTGGRTGNRLMIFNTSSYGRARQSIAVNIGRTYRLRYSFKKGSASRGFVSLGTVLWANDIYYKTDLQDTDWIEYSIDFVATVSTVFLDLGNYSELEGESSSFDDISLADITI